MEKLKNAKLITEKVKVVQVIGGALVIGLGLSMVLIFLTAEAAPVAEAFLAYFASGFGILCFFAWIIVPGIISRQASQSIANGKVPKVIEQSTLPKPTDAESQLILVFVSRWIIGSAILEGAGFANAMIYLVEGQMMSLVVALALMCVLAMQIPSVSRVEDWIDQTTRDIELLRISK